MFCSLRRFLLIVLMLAIPFQGVAASVMSVAMAGHGHTARHAHAVQQKSAACHQAASASQSGMPDGINHSLDLSGKLKICASCCSIASQAVTSVPAHIPGAGEVYASWLIHEPQGVIPEGLERPPRLIS